MGNQKLAEPVQACPSCKGQELFRDGTRALRDGTAVQRWKCRVCGFRHSQHSKNRTLFPSGNSRTRINAVVYSDNSQVCANIGAKNLATATEIKTVAGDIVDFAWRQKKRGLSDCTIKNRTQALNSLIEKGARLHDPDSVETVLATEDFPIPTKINLVRNYAAYARTYGIQWQPIKVRYESPEPFIPTEQEIDQLIAGCGKHTATFLQVLKDTGARSGETSKIEWKDIDTVKKTISINRPSKGSRPRTVKITDKTIVMLNSIDKKYSPFVFNPKATLRDSFHISRKRLAQRLNNPRLLQIHFHTFRHWKATNEYAKNHDIKEVQQILGHKNLLNTDRYTHLLNLERDEWIVRRPKTPKDEDDLIVSGFQYVRYDEKEGAPIYRKRK